MHLTFADIAHGYTYPDGDSIGGQIIGRGSFMMRHLTPLDPASGRGMPGPSWTVGCQAVEVGLDLRRLTYRVLKAVSVIDAGRVVNPRAATGVVMGGMCQGLGCGSREHVHYAADGRLLTRELRTYKVLRAGEQPEYAVEFVETPQLPAPCGARPLGEHGIIAMPAALASALSVAAQVELDHLPLTPERIWWARAAGRR